MGGSEYDLLYQRHPYYYERCGERYGHQRLRHFYRQHIGCNLGQRTTARSHQRHSSGMPGLITDLQRSAGRRRHNLRMDVTSRMVRLFHLEHHFGDSRNGWWHHLSHRDRPMRDVSGLGVACEHYYIYRTRPCHRPYFGLSRCIADLFDHCSAGGSGLYVVYPCGVVW